MSGLSATRPRGGSAQAVTEKDCSWRLSLTVAVYNSPAEGTNGIGDGYGNELGEKKSRLAAPMVQTVLTCELKIAMRPPLKGDENKP
jgi:hypothetical protein